MSHKLVKIASLGLGGQLVALAATGFVVPHGPVLGGSTGIALIVTHLAPLPLSLAVLVINVALFLLAAALLWAIDACVIAGQIPFSNFEQVLLGVLSLTLLTIVIATLTKGTG